MSDLIERLDAVVDDARANGYGLDAVIWFTEPHTVGLTVKDVQDIAARIRVLEGILRLLVNDGRASDFDDAREILGEGA